MFVVKISREANFAVSPKKENSETENQIILLTKSGNFTLDFEK